MDAAAIIISRLYDQPFGGRDRGRFRLSMKHLRQISGRNRLYPEDIAALTRALYERGFVMVDMETFFVILSIRTFSNYRRLNDPTLLEHMKKTL